VTVQMRPLCLPLTMRILLPTAGPLTLRSSSLSSAVLVCLMLPAQPRGLWPLEEAGRGIKTAPPFRGEGGGVLYSVKQWSTRMERGGVSKTATVVPHLHLCLRVGGPRATDFQEMSL